MAGISPTKKAGSISRPKVDRLVEAIRRIPNTEVTAIIDGVRMVLKLFEDQAGRLGLTKVKAVGERFDPAIHDAIQQVETDDHMYIEWENGQEIDQCGSGNHIPETAFH